MLRIATFKLLLKDLKDNSSNKILGIMTARSEAELSKIVKDISDFNLIGIIPSSDTDEHSFNNITETDTVVLYVLKPVGDGDRDLEDTTDQEIAQDIIAGIKERLYYIAEHCEHALHQTIMELNFGSMHTDPEYNYMGCDGYSLSFTLKTNWF